MKKKNLVKRIEHLTALLAAPPAEMSYNGRLVPINSTGMRAIVDEATTLRIERNLTLVSLKACIAATVWRPRHVNKPMCVTQAEKLIQRLEGE